MSERVHETASTTPTERTVVREQTVMPQAELIAPRDSVRWGPVFAGFLTALGTFVILSLLLLAVGANAVRVAGTNVDPTASSGIATAVVGLLSFFIGGFVAGRTAAGTGRWAGFLNGFLVWALGLLLIIALAAFGLGQLFGAAGELFGQYRAAGSPQPQGVDPNAVARGFRDAAVPAFLSVALPALAAAVGDFLGSRDDVFRPTAYRREG